MTNFIFKPSIYAKKMKVGKFDFIYILRIFISNESNKTRLQRFYKFKCDYENLISI